MQKKICLIVLYCSICSQKKKKLCSYCFLLQSAMCRSAKSWCVVTMLSPRKTLAKGLRACVYCSRGNPTRRSVGFWCRCGTKVLLIHCSASNQLDEERIDTSLGLCMCVCVCVCALKHLWCWTGKVVCTPDGDQLKTCHHMSSGTSRVLCLRFSPRIIQCVAALGMV